MDLTSPADLQPAAINPSHESPGQAEALKASIREFGDIAGITWNRRTGRLVTGHKRVEQLAALGARLEFSPPRYLCNGDEFQIRVVDWDDATAKAANIAANSPKLCGTFAVIELEGVLRELSECAFFDDLLFDELLASVEKPAEVEGEIKFAEELLEENNYVVLQFSNSVDWQAALTHFGLESRYNKRQNGKPWSCGIGRVVDGGEYLRRISQGAMEGER